MKKYAVISADIVSSTSLSRDALIDLNGGVKAMLGQLSAQYPGFWGRLVKGDSIECVLDDPHEALRVAVMIKAFIKAFVPTDGIAGPRFKQFGLRLAIGIGEMRTIDRTLDIMDGEAIYLAGRALAEMRNRTSDSFLVVAPIDVSNGALPVMALMLNHLLNKATPRQCEVLYHRLQCRNDAEVATLMRVSRPGVNQSLRSMGWDVVERTIKYFEQLNFEA